MTQQPTEIKTENLPINDADVCAEGLRVGEIAVRHEERHRGETLLVVHFPAQEFILQLDFSADQFWRSLQGRLLQKNTRLH